MPARVPASRASIRARWKRRTLRPASATWSSAVTPGRLADDEAACRRPVGLVDGLARRRRTSDGGPRRCAGVAVAGSPTSARPSAADRRRPPARRDRRRLGVGLVVDRSTSASSAPRRPLAVGRSAPRTDAPAPPPSLLPRRAARAPGRAAKTVGERRSSRSSSPLTQLGLELDEPIDDPRPRTTTSTSSRLSSTRVSPSRTIRLRRSWRIVTSSTSGASPASSRTSDRASDAGQSSGPARPVGRAFELLATDRRRPAPSSGRAT